MDFAAERYVEWKYDFPHEDVDLQSIVVAGDAGKQDGNRRPSNKLDHGFLHSGDQRDDLHALAQEANEIESTKKAEVVPDKRSSHSQDSAHADERGLSDATALHNKGHSETDLEVEQSFRMQIAAFLILEFGVVFHSVIIGLNLGTAGDEFSTLYPVLVFHQSFEGLGIGARMSAIPFPSRYHWLPWFLCAAYGLTTPIAIAIGLGLRTTYNSGSFTASVVSGVLDSTSAGILLWTGLVELLARDFLFDPKRTKDNKRLTFMVGCTLVGIALMALLGKWA